MEQAEAAAAAECEDGELADEMVMACNALGHELSRLAEFMQWAEGVVDQAEVDSGLLPGGSEAARWLEKSAEEAQRGPERFYIGDGIVAQLLADAEAVA